MHEYIGVRIQKGNACKRVRNEYNTCIYIDVHLIAESEANDNNKNDEFKYIFYAEMVLLNEVQAVETVASKHHVAHVYDPAGKVFKKSEGENNKKHR
jgi:hypothetical protein